MQMQTRFQVGHTLCPPLDPVNAPRMKSAFAKCMQEGPEAQNKKSKRICGDQGTVALYILISSFWCEIK